MRFKKFINNIVNYYLSSHNHHVGQIPKEMEAVVNLTVLGATL